MARPRRPGPALLPGVSPAPNRPPWDTAFPEGGPNSGPDSGLRGRQSPPVAWAREAREALGPLCRQKAKSSQAPEAAGEGESQASLAHEEPCCQARPLLLKGAQEASCFRGGSSAEPAGVSVGLDVDRARWVALQVWSTSRPLAPLRPTKRLSTLRLTNQPLWRWLAFS